MTALRVHDGLDHEAISSIVSSILKDMQVDVAQVFTLGTIVDAGIFNREVAVQRYLISSSSAGSRIRDILSLVPRLPCTFFGIAIPASRMLLMWPDHQPSLLSIQAESTAIPSPSPGSLLPLQQSPRLQFPLLLPNLRIKAMAIHAREAGAASRSLPPVVVFT